MQSHTLWIIIAAIGLVTFSLRLSFIAFSGKLSENPKLQHILRLVPASVLSALVISGMLVTEGRVHFDPLDASYPAAILAGVIAWRTKSLFWTIVTGMLSLWLLRWLLALAVGSA